MAISAHSSRRFAAATLATAALALGVPVAQADTDGSILSCASEQAGLQQASRINPGVVTDGTLLTRASEQASQLLKINPGRVTDGTLLTRASRQAAFKELATINPGRVTDGMLLTEASLLHQLAQINPGRGTGESIVSETAARTPAGVPASRDGFDWGDAAAGFGAAAFAAALLAGAALTVRRRGTLIDLP